MFRLMVTQAPASYLLPGMVLPELALTKERTSIGRRRYNDLVLEDTTVSGEHAVVEKQGDRYELVDTGSSNGSFVNGLRVSRKTLRAGDSIQLGSFQLKLIANNVASAPSHIGTAQARPFEHEVEPTTTSSPSESNSPYVEFLSGPMKGLRQSLRQGINKIGQKDPIALLAIHQEQCLLTHLEGSKPSRLNGEILGIGARALQSNNEILLGDLRLRFVNAAKSSANSTNSVSSKESAA